MIVISYSKVRLLVARPTPSITTVTLTFPGGWLEALQSTCVLAVPYVVYVVSKELVWLHSAPPRCTTAVAPARGVISISIMLPACPEVGETVHSCGAGS